MRTALRDDRLRLIFTCCHPSLAPEAHVALTLREVCGLTTEEIAKAFLTRLHVRWRSALCAQRQRFARHGFRMRCRRRRNCRSDWTRWLQVIYLVFNEGYSAAAGAEVTRAELTGARRFDWAGCWCRTPSQSRRVIGLLALMLLQESRGARSENLCDRRADFAGELATARAANREQIAEGVTLLDNALKSHRFGAYMLQAAIALVHAEAESKLLRLTGGRLLRFTTNWYDFSLRRLSISIVPWPLPCAMVQKAGLAYRRVSAGTWRNWQITTWRIQPVPICAAGWAGPLRPGLLMGKLLR